ncbi:nucleotidyltransferase family protein [Catalinimonas niigatensis]|uniref:nucleotidyltransferase family protein n=1 Tax=Catalinimonas niigatensis TaxID=1397264 RepID=UPI0026654401|nr:nucleotidyltransferase family protein [Catalinimonas niigatensis]WPP51661.1 nucleotidyltransferase family protein [Catalinimonas niigatensis]
MVTSYDIANKLKEIKPYLADKFKVKEIGFFGSFAQGDYRIDSDVDILVEFSSTPGWEFFMLEEYLEKVLERKVDLVTKAALREQLKEQILQSVQYID